jgi:hypothetical protein
MFWIELNKTLVENYTIDRIFTSIFRHDAIVKKIEYVRLALDILGDAVVLPLKHKFNYVTWSLMLKWRISIRSPSSLQGNKPRRLQES